MSKIEFNFELLKLFNEDEINTVCKNADLALFLIPIKDKRYTKYAKKLGRLDKKSALVQNFLPGIAFNLFKKGEEPFREAVTLQLETFQTKFLDAITNTLEPSISVEDIKKYDAKEMADLYFRILEISATDISKELFFIFLKLQDICLNDDIHAKVESEIDNGLQLQQIKVKYKNELEDALKEQEKRLHSAFENERRELKKQIDDKSRLQKELKDKLNLAEEKNRKYENQTQNEKKALKEEWFFEYEKELSERKNSDELEWQNAHTEAERKHAEYILNLEAEAERKKIELETEYQERQRIEEEKYFLKKEELLGQIEILNENEQSLNQQIKLLEEEKLSLEKHIENLENVEEKYFDTFEKRIVEKRIDSLIFQKLGYDRVDTDNSGTVNAICEKQADIVVVEPVSFSNNSKAGEVVNSIEDFFDDLRDNISINFECVTEIAGLILAAVSNKMAIISVDTVNNHLSESIAALVDYSTPLKINVDAEKGDFKEIVDVITTSNSQVVCVNGVLDNYNENLFRRICEICNEKILFFSVSDIDKLNMMSKSVLNYAILIDVEEELQFPVDEFILLGDHDLRSLLPELDMRKSKEIYKKRFSRFVNNRYMKKSTALKYTNLLQVYMELVDGGVLGDIIQKSILNACTFKDAGEDLDDVLKKSGITVALE